MIFDVLFSCALGIAVGLLTTRLLKQAVVKTVTLTANRAAVYSFANHCIRLGAMGIPVVFLWMEMPFAIWPYFAALMGTKMLFIVSTVRAVKAEETAVGRREKR